MNRFLIIFILFFAIACGSSNDEEKDTSLLPPSSGGTGEIILVIDSTLYSDTVGKAIKNVLSTEILGLPREEPHFTVRQIEPGKMNNVLRNVSNLIFVMTLEDTSPGTRRVRQYFTESSLNKIKEQPDLFMFTAEDLYAKNQQVLYLFSKTSEQLAGKIIENKEKIRNLFNTVERERLEDRLFKGKVPKGLSNMLVQDHQFYMKIPFGYQVAENSNQFVWFRQMNDDSDKNIFITYKPYTSESQFTKDQIIFLRDSIASRKLFEDPDYPDTYIITETGVPFKPVVTKKVNFNGLYAIETRGLWRTRTASMGGPFISYTFVDENLGRLYYIEGFLYSPGVSQRELMRELEVILHTFEPRS